MSSGSHDIITDELHAFIDGALDPRRKAEIATIVARSPELREHVAKLQGDQAVLVRLYGPLIDLPLPSKLVQAVASEPLQRSKERNRTRFAPALAAAAVVLALLAGYWVSRTNGGDSLVAEAIAARDGQIQPDRLFMESTMTGPADRIMTAALGVEVRTPDLRKSGYRLQTVRFFPEAGKSQAVELRYQDTGGKLFTVFLHRTAGSDRFDLQERGPLRVCIWQNDELAAVMVGQMSSSEMLRVASLTYADLNL